MKWPFARKSTYNRILATYREEFERAVAERDELREEVDGLREAEERRRRPRLMGWRGGQAGAETHPDLFPLDDRPASVWEQYPKVDAVWIPIGPFVLDGHPYDEGFVQACRPAPDPRLEREPVTLWEGFDLVPTDEDDKLDWYGALSVPPEPKPE